MIYTVRPGETLWDIANRFGVSVQAIMSANGIVNPNAVFAGQQLFIPIPPGVPPTPGPGVTIRQRVSNLERRVTAIERQITNLDRRVRRLEGSRENSRENSPY